MADVNPELAAKKVDTLRRAIGAATRSAERISPTLGDLLIRIDEELGAIAAVLPAPSRAVPDLDDMEAVRLWLTT